MIRAQHFLWDFGHVWALKEGEEKKKRGGKEV